MRTIGTAFLVSLLAIVAAFGWATWYVRTASPDRAGEFVVPGLDRPVEVWRDSLGVPHIWAASAADMAFAQGFVHAQDRLWQMELFRRVAEGRLAEALGDAAVGTDRFLRTLGLWRAAARTERALTPEMRRLLEAYAAGVNARLAVRDGALPTEFLVLGIEPEPWTVRHSVAIEKVMSWDLAAYGTGLSLARAVRRLGPERAAVLFPDRAARPATILEGPLPPEPPASAVALLDAMSITRASNAWVIAGERTRSGRPILANDPHLALRAPSLWYLAALHAAGDPTSTDPSTAAYDVAGVTIPGTPFVVLGHNRAVAWGFTNAMIDDVDFFVERVDPTDPTRYLTPDGSAPFEFVRDTIRVKGADEPIVHTTRLTRHGPVLTPVEHRAAGELIAMRWAAHDPSTTVAAFARLDQARDWDSFVEAVRRFDNPHQNVVYADTAGHIGYWMGGTVPIRGDGRPPPLLPVPGWTGEWDWTGTLPFERHPHVLDPASGYLVTANNRQTEGDGAGLITAEWAAPYRARRIHEMIEAADVVDVDAVRAQQLDVRDLRAEAAIGAAVDAAERAGLAEAADRLRAWDLRATAGSRAAAVFYLWHESLGRRAAARLYGGDDAGADLGAEADAESDGARWFPREAIDDLIERRALPWVDDGAAAAFDSLAARAMRDAVRRAEGRAWGELHRTAALHSFADAGLVGELLDRVLDFNVGPVPDGGSTATVNVSEHGRLPAVSTYGPSMRHVVDMADVDGAGGFVIPTGQSGLPFEVHYRDQWPMYREGRLWHIPLDRAGARRRVVRRMTLKPKIEGT